MTISFSHRSVYYVPGTNCSLCLGIDSHSCRRLLLGCSRRGFEKSLDTARKSDGAEKMYGGGRRSRISLENQVCGGALG